MIGEFNIYRSRTCRSNPIYQRACHLTTRIESRIRIPTCFGQMVGKIIWRLIDEGKMKQGGIGVYSSFCHYDTRGTKARWPRFGAWRKE